MTKKTGQWPGHLPCATILVIPISLAIASNLDLAKKIGQCRGYLPFTTCLAIPVSRDIASNSSHDNYRVARQG